MIDDFIEERFGHVGTGVVCNTSKVNDPCQQLHYSPLLFFQGLGR